MVPLKYLSDFWRTLGIALINCKVNLILTWYSKCVSPNDAKLYLPVVTLSTQDNAKLLQQLKLGFKRTINWSKYQSKVTMQVANIYLDYLIDSSFQEVYRPFVLSFKNNIARTVDQILSTLKIKDYDVMINEQNFFDQPAKNNLRTYDNIQKIATG